MDKENPVEEENSSQSEISNKTQMNDLSTPMETNDDDKSSVVNKNVLNLDQPFLMFGNSLSFENTTDGKSANFEFGCTSTPTDLDTTLLRDDNNKSLTKRDSNFVNFISADANDAYSSVEQDTLTIDRNGKSDPANNEGITCTDSTELNVNKGDEDSNSFTSIVRSAIERNRTFLEQMSSNSAEDVICLSDDDDEVRARPKKPLAARKCINPCCMSGEGLYKPAMFVLSYFGIKHTRNQLVCEECFNMVAEHYEKLGVMLKEGKPLLSADFPSHKDIILIDSDEDSVSDDESCLSDGTMKTIQDNLDDVIAETLTKYDLDHQIRESCRILDTKIETLEEDSKTLDKSFDQIQQTLDEFRRQIYNEFTSPIEEIDELHIVDVENPPMPIFRNKHQNKKGLANTFREKEVREGHEKQQQPLPGPSRTIATKKVTPISQIPSNPGHVLDGTAAEEVTVINHTEALKSKQTEISSSCKKKDEGIPKLSESSKDQEDPEDNSLERNGKHTEKINTPENLNLSSEHNSSKRRRLFSNKSNNVNNIIMSSLEGSAEIPNYKLQLKDVKVTPVKNIDRSKENQKTKSIDINKTPDGVAQADLFPSKSEYFPQPENKSSNNSKTVTTGLKKNKVKRPKLKKLDDHLPVRIDPVRDAKHRKNIEMQIEPENANELKEIPIKLDVYARTTDLMCEAPKRGRGQKANISENINETITKESNSNVLKIRKPRGNKVLDSDKKPTSNTCHQLQRRNSPMLFDDNEETDKNNHVHNSEGKLDEDAATYADTKQIEEERLEN